MQASQGLLINFKMAKKVFIHRESNIYLGGVVPTWNVPTGGKAHSNIILHRSSQPLDQRKM